MNFKEQYAEAGALLTRRTILKLIAGAPLVATFGFVASPLLRYLKPTMKPGNFFQSADLPKADQSVRFHRLDFPQSWTCAYSHRIVPGNRIVCSRQIAWFSAGHSHLMMPANRMV